MVDMLIQKLRMIGANVLSYNDFGVIYQSRANIIDTSSVTAPIDTYSLIKLTYSSDGTKVIEKEVISGFSSYEVSKHFIRVAYTSGRNQCGLYIKTSRKNLVSRNKTIYFYDSNDDATTYLGEGKDTSEVLLYETRDGKSIAVNNLGIKINISRYLRLGRHDIAIGIAKMQNGRYRFGYGQAKVLGSWPSRVKYITELKYWFIDTDAGFRDIKYNPNLGEHYLDKQLLSRIRESEKSLSIYAK